MEKNAVYWSLVEELAMRQGVLFVGAGLSMGAGAPGWQQLLQRLNQELATGFGAPRGDFLDYAERLDQAVGRIEFGRCLARILAAPHIQPSAVHRALLSLPFYAVFTTNYDKLLERTLGHLQRPYDAIRYDEEVGVIDHHEAMPIIKFHGDLEDPPGIVLTRTDYELYALKHPAFLSLFEALLATRTFVFVGFGLADSNFQALDRTVQRALGRYRRKAYAIMVDDGGDRLDPPPHFEILWVPLNQINQALLTLADDVKALIGEPASDLTHMEPAVHSNLKRAFATLPASLFQMNRKAPGRPRRRVIDGQTRAALYQLVFDMERFRMQDQDYWMRLGIAFFKIRDYRASLRALGHLPMHHRESARIVARCHWYLGEKWRTRRIFDHLFYPNRKRDILDREYLRALPGDASFFAHTCNWEASEHLERRRFHRTRFLANRGLAVLHVLLDGDLQMPSDYAWSWRYVYNHIGRSHLLLWLAGDETDEIFSGAETHLLRAIELAKGGFPEAWSNLLDLYKAADDRERIATLIRNVLASRQRHVIAKIKAWHPDVDWA